MLLGLITLLTALCISGIAAYYSIVGLTAIFAAAVFPVMLMGGVLEVGKVVTTLWLHYNWDRAPWKIRSYLVSAVGILMLITSMGIFGFLSKAHLEQAVPSGDVQAQVALFDEKIKTQRDNIESNRKALAQMDASVDQMMARTDTEQGATKSANLRSSQKKERARLFTEIDDSQKAITKLQEERAPVASKLRKVEAEVGPIKYIAALIYGDKADQNMLEAAVRWVIIIIVAVFDPLAIILLLAATTSIDWSKLDRTKRKHEQLEEAKEKAEIAKLEAEAIALVQPQDLPDPLAGAILGANFVPEVDIEQIISETKAITRADVENEFQPLIEAERVKIKEIEEALLTQQSIIDEYVAMATVNGEQLVKVENYAVSLVDQITESTAQLEQMKLVKADRENKVSDLNAALTQINDELSVTYSSVDELLEQYNHAETRNEDLTDELYSVTADYNKLLQDKVALMELLSTEQSATNELATVVSSIENEVTTLTKALSDKTDEADKLRRELELLLVVTPPEDDILSTPFFPHEEPVIEDLPSNEEILQVAAETKDDFYKQIFEILEEVKLPETIPEPVVEVVPEPMVDNFSELLTQDVAAAVEAEATPVAMPKLPAMPAMKKVAKIIPDDNFPLGGNASFGTSFPANPIKGDLYLRVDFMPSKLYKWVGTRWIEMDKSTSDTYAYDLEYIKLLIDKVNTGEYDIDDLSQVEQDQIAAYLQNNPN